MKRPAGPFRTQRLLLRPFTPGDLDAFHAIYGREDVTQYLDHGPRSRSEAAGMLERISAMTAIDDAGGALRLAAVLPESGTVIGDFSLWTASDEHAQGEIGFVLHPDRQGHGYALEAAREMLRIGFEEVGLHRIVGRCDAANLASARLMERLGMRREAHFRENQLIKGAWSSELVYAVLAGEWTGR
jgi:RimJ/RimL family protein N-acetyltransferase